MMNRHLFYVWRALYENDGQGGARKRYRKIGEERGNTINKILTGARTFDVATEGGVAVTRVTHQGFFRAGADILEGDFLTSSDGTLGDVNDPPVLEFEVISRRYADLGDPDAEFELLERREVG